MITRQALAELMASYISARDKITDVGYALDDLHTPSRSAAPSLGQANLSIIDEVARATVSINQMIVRLEDVKPHG